MVWREPTDTGWRVEASADIAEVRVLDPGGIVQGTLQVPPRPVFTGRFAKRQNKVTTAAFERNGPRLVTGRPVELTLPEGGGATVQDGANAATRRAKKGGTAALRGRDYRLRHVFGRKARVLRDGTEIAVLKRRGGLRSLRVARSSTAATDLTDELVLTIFEKVIKPGRSGACSEIVSALDLP